VGALYNEIEPYAANWLENLVQAHHVALEAPPPNSNHVMQGPPGWRCSCGTDFTNYAQLAEHVRLTIPCPHCGIAAAVTLKHSEVCRWTCGHWIARGDQAATLREPY
jgi:hypothetical protein